MNTGNRQPTRNRPNLRPMTERGARHRQNKQKRVSTKGLYQRAFKEAFVKLNPKVMLKNPVMFVVWVGTIVTAIATIAPTLLGSVSGEDERLFNGLVTIIIFFTLLFANFAEAVAEGRGKAQADSLRATKSDTIAKKYCLMVPLKK